MSGCNIKVYHEGEVTDQYQVNNMDAATCMEHDKRLLFSIEFFIETGMEKDGSFYLIRDTGDNCIKYFDI